MKKIKFQNLINIEIGSIKKATEILNDIAKEIQKENPDKGNTKEEKIIFDNIVQNGIMKGYKMKDLSEIKNYFKGKK